MTPVGHSETSRDGSPLVTVRMSEQAAERLAKACRRAESMIHDAVYEDDRKVTKDEAETMEMLGWGGRWLVNPEARGDATPKVVKRERPPISLEGHPDAEFLDPYYEEKPA